MLGSFRTSSPVSNVIYLLFHPYFVSIGRYIYKMSLDKQDIFDSSSSHFVSADISISSAENSTESLNSLKSYYFVENARKWWKVDILLNALSALNSPVNIRCVENTKGSSDVVFFPKTNTIEISAPSFYTPFAFRRALARGLVYAFDEARAKVDYSNADHVSCTSIRAVNISGECELWTKWLDYFGEDPLGKDMYSMKQRCIRKRVEEQMIMGSRFNSDEIRSSIDGVWTRCFRDHWPFTTEPHMDTRFRDSPLRRDL